MHFLTDVLHGLVSRDPVPGEADADLCVPDKPCSPAKSVRRPLKHGRGTVPGGAQGTRFRGGSRDRCGCTLTEPHGAQEDDHKQDSHTGPAAHAHVGSSSRHSTRSSALSVHLPPLCQPSLLLKVASGSEIQTSLRTFQNIPELLPAASPFSLSPHVPLSSLPLSLAVSGPRSSCSSLLFIAWFQSPEISSGRPYMEAG